MKLITKTIMGLLAIPVLITSNITNAGEIDARTYPASMGVEKSYSQGTIGYFYGAIKNTSSTEWLTVDLPSIMRFPTSEIGSYVTVMNNNPTASIHCIIMNNDNYPVRTYSYGSRQFSSYSDGRREVLHTGKSNGYGDSTFIECNIPPTYLGRVSMISSYRMVVQHWTL